VELGQDEGVALFPPPCSSGEEGVASEIIGRLGGDLGERVDSGEPTRWVGLSGERQLGMLGLDAPEPRNSVRIGVRDSRAVEDGVGVVGPVDLLASMRNTIGCASGFTRGGSWLRPARDTPTSRSISAVEPSARRRRVRRGR